SFSRDWSSDVCSSDLNATQFYAGLVGRVRLVTARSRANRHWWQYSDNRSLPVAAVHPDPASNSVLANVDGVNNAIKFARIGSREIGRASCRERVEREV